MITPLKDINSSVFQKPYSIKTVQGTSDEIDALKLELRTDGVLEPLIVWNTDTLGYYTWNGSDFKSMVNNGSYNFTFGSNKQSYLKSKDTTFEVLSEFFYLGKDVTGVPENIKVSFTNKGGITSSIRIYDVTNANIIAEVTGIAPTIEEIFQTIDLGVISNLPNLEARFEVQLNVSSSGGMKETWVNALLIN